MSIEKETIKKHYLILCEGKDAHLFLIQFLESKALKNDIRFANDIQVFEFAGINRLGSCLHSLQNTEGFDLVNRILVIRDAETAPRSAEQSIQTALRNNKLPTPTACNKWSEVSQNNIQTAYTLFPTCSETAEAGALEDLCWKILTDSNAEQVQAEILQFIELLKSEYSRKYPREFKNRIHTYFSVTDDYVSLKIGEAAKAGAFNWEAAALCPLRELIRSGFSVI